MEPNTTPNSSNNTPETPLNITPANPAPEPQTSTSITPQPKPKRKFNLPVIILASTTVIFAGLATFFGYQYLTNDQSNNTQSTVAPSETQSINIAESSDSDTITYKNPVITSNNPDQHYVLDFTSAIFSTNDGKEYTLDLAVENGEISSCIIYTDIQNIGDYGTSKRKNADCQINGLDGKIYKIVEVGEGHDASGDIAAFIMENGSVEYIKLQEAFDNMSFNINGKIPVDGFVTDIIDTEVYNDATGYHSELFMLHDGTYVKYDPDSMLGA